MTEYPLQHLAEKFYNLFQGNQSLYGRSELTGEVDNKGKHIARSWTIKEPITRELWEQHLKGQVSIGQVPIRPDGTVTWIAFDVDIYKNGINIKEFLARIRGLNLPIMLFRSKSGGAHALIFFSESVVMETIRPKVGAIAATLEIGSCEIFPKQDRIGATDSGDARYGNWLNMPYDGPTSSRYAYKDESNGYTPSEFLDTVENIKISKKDFLAIELPGTGGNLEDGPPCLNYITANKIGLRGGRNTLLFNLATYFKKRNPEAGKPELTNFLLDWNRKLTTPLEEKEIKATILKSTSQRDYQYQCGDPLLKKHCDSNVCKTCLYGIDGDENAFDPNNKTLIQMLTDPPLYFLIYKDTQLRMTRDQLWNYEAVRKECMEQACDIPPPMKQEHWLNLLQGYLESVTIIEMPPETTAIGQFVEILNTWRKRATEDSQELANGNPVVDKKERLIFRFQDLKQLLKWEQFKALPDNRITEVLKNHLMAEYGNTRCGESIVKAWKIDMENLTDPNLLQLKEPENEKENF